MKLGCPNSADHELKFMIGGLREYQTRPGFLGTRLGEMVTGEGARDDQALDLTGALEDGVDLGVAVPALDWMIADVARAAEDLDRLLGDRDGDLTGLELRRRALARLERAV